MARITKTLLEARAKIACEGIGLTYGPHWAGIGQGFKAQVGNVVLSKAFKGWDLEQIENEQGGVRMLNGSWNSMSSAEMLAFIDGLIVAARHLKSGEV